MPAVPSWAPAAFYLTNPYNGSMTLNTVVADRKYLIDGNNSKFTMGVRQTTDNVPQADGSIPHHRFLTGAQISMLIQLWDAATGLPACDAVLADMLDDISGAFRSLLNAGDNAGRLAWEVAGKPTRMLDDVRLLVYPDFESNSGANPWITVTIDSKYPYAQDLNQSSTDVADGDTEELNNTGTAEYFPVFKVWGPISNSGDGFTIENTTTGIQFVYDTDLPGAIGWSASEYAEISCFDNTIYLNGDSSDLKAGVDELNSDYMGLIPGANEITIDGADMTVLWAPAWG